MRKKCFLLKTLDSPEGRACACPICLVDLRQRGPRCIVAALSCGHVLHVGCARALERAVSCESYGESRVLRCPCCRANIAYTRTEGANVYANSVYIDGRMRAAPVQHWHPSGLVRMRMEACYAIALTQIKTACTACIPDGDEYTMAFWQVVARMHMRRRVFQPGCVPIPLADVTTWSVDDRDLIDYA